MDKKKKKKKKKFFFFFSDWEFFVWNWEKNILFGIGNGAEFRPQNRVIESPARSGPTFYLGPNYLQRLSADGKNPR